MSAQLGTEYNAFVMDASLAFPGTLTALNVDGEVLQERRLVAPDIASSDEATLTRDELVAVEPFPESERHDAALLQAELDRRLAEWAAQLPPEMSRDEIADAMLTIWHAMGDQPETEDSWLVTRELLARVVLLCQRLPHGDDLRSDFCASPVVQPAS